MYVHLHICANSCVHTFACACTQVCKRQLLPHYTTDTPYFRVARSLRHTGLLHAPYIVLGNRKAASSLWSNASFLFKTAFHFLTDLRILPRKVAKKLNCASLVL